MKFQFNKIVLISLLFILGCSTRANKKLHSYTKDEIQIECQHSIESWIKNHSIYPESYSSQKFEKVQYYSKYQNGIEIIPLRKYYISHTFQLLDTHKLLLLETLDFELTLDYFIDHVHYKREYINQDFDRIFPPIYDDFILQFGKSITADDSASWRLNQREVLYDLSTKFNKSRSQNLEKTTIDSLINLINQAYKN